jgi:hypothetical protein
MTSNGVSQVFVGDEVVVIGGRKIGRQRKVLHLTWYFAKIRDPGGIVFQVSRNNLCLLVDGDSEDKDEPSSEPLTFWDFLENRPAR